MMRPRILLLTLALGLCMPSADSRQLRLHRKIPSGPLDGFHPEEVLCTLGQDGKGRDRTFPWCIDWVQCLKKEAQPAGTPEAVLKAWKPANCHEACGLWPPKPKPVPTTPAPVVLLTTTKPVVTTTKPVVTTTKPVVTTTKLAEMEGEMEDEVEGEMVDEMEDGEMVDEMEDEDEDYDYEDEDWERGGELEFLKHRSNRTLSFLSAANQKKNACVDRCEQWQKTFSTCVATIIFEPGQLAGMGMQKKGGLRKQVPAVCTSEDSPCTTELAIHHQNCLHYRTKSIVNPDYHVPDEEQEACAHIAEDYDECKECPQMTDDYKSQYTAFTGGCLDQMHAYRQATTPRDTDIGLPRETGTCTLQG